MFLATPHGTEATVRDAEPQTSSCKLNSIQKPFDESARLHEKVREVLDSQVQQG